MKNRSINIFMLTMINLATILSIRNWPATAEYGLSSIIYLLLAMVGYFIPTSLVSAELATRFPHKGGIFHWVKLAMGHRLGLLAIWLLWVENIIYYPVVLSFCAATFAYLFMPALAGNSLYLFCMIVGVFWIVTLINLLGIQISGWISTVGVVLGTLFPGILLIFLGWLWLSMGKISHIGFTWSDLIPRFSSISEMAFLTGILLSLMGIEMPAVHVNDVENPKRNYPIAIAISAFIIIVTTILGTLTIAIVIPQHDIKLLSGGIETIYIFFQSVGAAWIIPLIALLIAFGAIGTLSTWVAGPCRGLLASAEDGDFPPFLQKCNKHNMPISLMLLQGAIATLLSLLFVFVPNVQHSFWMLTTLASQVYLVMYVLMFLAGIILRYKKKEVQGKFKIPLGNVGMWIIALIGLISSLFALIIGFFPPTQLKVSSKLFYVLFLSIGLIIICLVPFVLYQLRKKSWKLSQTHHYKEVP